MLVAATVAVVDVVYVVILGVVTVIVDIDTGPMAVTVAVVLAVVVDIDTEPAAVVVAVVMAVTVLGTGTRYTISVAVVVKPAPSEPMDVVVTVLRALPDGPSNTMTLTTSRACKLEVISYMACNK